ncbi:hypothetical protein C7438_1286 [Brockia lithotrophica]|uniref:Uncharacterized protein n=1 Tax=Brockia lithotrophica TaxID=933949 RepID=A0A660KWL7_9BACL|nr:hypothetical protein C7438_1286 [Brockia lithotrophica]
MLVWRGQDGEAAEGVAVGAIEGKCFTMWHDG